LKIKLLRVFRCKASLIVVAQGTSYNYGCEVPGYGVVNLYAKVKIKVSFY